MLAWFLGLILIYSIYWCVFMSRINSCIIYHLELVEAAYEHFHCCVHLACWYE